MRLGLLVRRLNQLPHVQPVARAAKERGHEVVLVLDQRGAATGAKASQTPMWHRLPSRWFGMVAGMRVWKTWDTEADLDALLVPGGIAYTPAELDAAFPDVPRLALQTAWSDLLWLGGTWDAVYCWSDWWRVQAREYFRAFGRAIPHRRGGSSVDLAPVIPVGYPLMDVLNDTPLYERTAIRRRLGVPDGRPVYVLAPFPFDSHDRQGWRLKWAYRYLGDAATVEAIRNAVTAQGGVLVVKSRPKTTLPGWTRAAADLVIEDAEAGEPTMLHLLAIADGAVGFYSMSVLEAAAAGCPWLCLAPTRWPAYGDRLGQSWWEPLHHAAPVSTRVPLSAWRAPTMFHDDRHSTALAWPDRASLRYLAGREQYVRTFLGPMNAGERIVADLEARIGTRSRGEEIPARRDEAHGLRAGGFDV